MTVYEIIVTIYFLYDELLINNSMKITKINLNLDDVIIIKYLL